MASRAVWGDVASRAGSRAAWGGERDAWGRRRGRPDSGVPDVPRAHAADVHVYAHSPGAGGGRGSGAGGGGGRGGGGGGGSGRTEGRYGAHAVRLRLALTNPGHRRTREARPARYCPPHHPNHSKASFLSQMASHDAASNMRQTRSVGDGGDRRRAVPRALPSATAGRAGCLLIVYRCTRKHSPHGV